MKTIAIMTLMILMIIPHTAKPNPILPPPPSQIFISELTFTSPSTWVLELETYIMMQDPLSASIFDSIIIQSNESRVRLLSFPVAYYQLFLVTPSIISGNLVINPVQDNLRVITYVGQTEYEHLLSYGYPGSEIPVLSQGQSISAHTGMNIMEYFYLDNSPTPGTENDTTGATVNLTGSFYDHHGTRITSVASGYNFVLEGNADSCNFQNYPGFKPLDSFWFDADGNYHTRYLSRNLKTENIYYMNMIYTFFALNFTNLPCSPFTYFSEPGDNQSQDIHLTDDTFLVGVKPEPVNQTSVVCYPNPVTGTAKFLVTSPDASGGEIVICNVNGVKVLQLTIPQEKKCELSFTRQDLGSSGMFIYSVMKNGKNISSGQIICR